MPVSAHYTPSTAILALGEDFYDRATPAEFPAAAQRFRNQPLAQRLGLGGLTEREWRAVFWAFARLPDNLEDSLALRYHGHRFQAYHPGPGDTRGFLHAQLRDPVEGHLLDLSALGSGRTPSSRQGDGRLSLREGVREVLAGELLHAAGAPTSRVLSLFETGEALQRDDEPSPAPSSVLVRCCHGHIRFGTFERLASRRDRVGMTRLMDYCVEHFFPAVADEPERPMALMRAIIAQCVELAAAWMVSGFVHGALHTDAMNVTGQSFEHGQWRCVPRYDEDFVAAAADRQGVYAYGRQHMATLWNLTRLAEAFGLLAPEAAVADLLYGYMPAYKRAHRRRFLAQLGVASRGDKHDDALIDAAQTFLSRSPVGWDRFFFDWFGGPASQPRALASPVAAHYEGDDFNALRRRMRRFEPRSPERLKHPYFQRQAPCTLLGHEVEAILRDIHEHGDWRPFEAKLDAIEQRGEATGLMSSALASPVRVG